MVAPCARTRPQRKRSVASLLDRLGAVVFEAEHVIRSPMTRNYWQHKRRLSTERARKMGIASQQAQRERRMECVDLREQEEIEIINLPRAKGDALGCLTWHDFGTGKVRRWVIRIGDRIDRITVESPGHTASKSHGWTWFLTQLRKKLA